MTSRLLNEQSAYLRSAVDQPVDWYPWGDEPFERARTEHKPILLDIGAVWCHWCHVMDHESYEDPGVAEILNRDWVCIKVDRDERPDVDVRYQRAVQALTGQGGWPLTVFLTADGHVFYGGTYFPPESAMGRPAFRTILTSLARVFRDSPDQILEQAAEITKHLAGSVRLAPQHGGLTTEVLTQGAEAMSRMFDVRHGGFGRQPKFPHPAACDFLLTRWFDTGEPWQRDIVRRTLDGMARGGVRDHLGGGFHRYSTDERWVVPHFEKMLYDNSELLKAYVHAAGAGLAAADGDGGSYREVIEGIVAWLTATMSDPGGGYYASQDADVQPGDDGDYFTWTPNEVRSVVDADEFAVLARRFEIGDVGEMHHDPSKNVLWLDQSISQIAAELGKDLDEVAALLASGTEKLRRARHQRSAPFVDPTIYTAWNAMMVSAVLEAAPSLEYSDLERQALATLERLFREAREPGPTGGMLRAVGSSVAGILDDQVQVASAAVDAYEATGDAAWLDRAIGLMEHVWTEFASKRGGLRDRRQASGEGFLDQEIIPIEDSPTPSPNGVAGIVLSRLAAHTGDPRWGEQRDALLEEIAGDVAKLSVFGATLLRAIDWALQPPTHIVIVGEDDDVTAALLRTARSVYRPRRVIRWLRPGQEHVPLPPSLEAMLDGAAPRAYVCAGTQCAPPVETAEALATTLATFGR